MIPKNNTFKNIKKAFIRKFIKMERHLLVDKCILYNLDIEYVLKTLCELKHDNQHNKNIRFLLRNKLINPLFNEFL